MSSSGEDGVRLEEAAVVPACLDWSVEEVGDWIESIGFPQYRESFAVNAVSGRRLVWVTSTTLPRMGITDWNHIQVISGKVRDLLGVEEPHWNRSITLPYASHLTVFLHQKSFTGRRSDQLTFQSSTP